MTEMVSIIVPAYNVQEWIGKTIESIINQTYSNLQIIAVNDDSTDSTGDILEKFASEDARIEVINKENGGLASARNKGLSAVQGYYTMFVDGDDYLSEETVERLVEAAKSHDADVVLFPYCRVFKNREIFTRILPNAEKLYSESDKHRLLRQMFGPINDEINVRQLDYLSTAWGKLYKTSILRFPFKGYEENYPEDLFFTIQNLVNVDRIFYTEKSVYYYNKLNDSSVTKHFSKNNFDGSNKLIGLLRKKATEFGDDFNCAVNNRSFLRLMSYFMIIGNDKDTSIRQKIAHINYVLSAIERYTDVELARTQMEYIALPWKLFFFCAIKQNSIGILMHVALINSLRRFVHG